MNYYKMMMEEIDKIKKEDKIPNLLLHTCCAPCSSHVIDTLTKYFNITVLYYNPNIEPLEEYNKRKEEQVRFIQEYKTKNKLKIMDCDYGNDIFHEKVKGLEEEPEGGIRCTNCFLQRLDKTAQLAKRGNFDYFATTLTVSPLKNSTKINEIGETLSKQYDIKYLYSDFKKKEGYKHSIELAKEYNLYRQDYCGCIYSKRKK